MNQAAAEVNWIPGITVLVLGIVIGLVILWISRKKSQTPSGPLDSFRMDARDLLAERDALLQRLRDMEDSDSDAGERYEIELRAARLLRQIGAMGSREVVEAVVAGGAPAKVGSSTMGFLYGAGSMAAIAALVFFVSTSASDREAGEPVTGNLPAQAQQGMQAEPIPGFGDLLQRVNQNPNDLVARLDLAQAMMMSDDLMGTFEQTKFVLENEPNNARALSYQAVVRLAMGQSDLALDMLDRAVVADPSILEVWVHKALVEATVGRMDEAEGTIDAAYERFPADSATLDGLRNHVRTQFAEGPGVPFAGQENPHEGIATEMTAMPPQTRASSPAASPPVANATGKDGISGTLHLDANTAARLQLPAVLFILARPAGVAEGSPIAVNRMIARSFPLVFSIGPEHAMMGGTLTDSLRLEVRVDDDGDPATRTEGDAVGVVDHVAIGTNNLRIDLK